MDVRLSRQHAATFHHPRHPHTCQLWFAFAATLIYAMAVPGMISIHNPLGALGWGLACVICLGWFLLLRQENKWRRMEQLEVQHPTDADPFGPMTQLPASSSASNGLLMPPHTHRSHSYPLTQSVAAYRSAFPCYLTKLAIGCVIALVVGLLSCSTYLFVKAGIEHQRLNGRSQWLGAIAFAGAAKSAAQLGWRMRKMRNTFNSVQTYMHETYTPLP